MPRQREAKPSLNAKAWNALLKEVEQYHKSITNKAFKNFNRIVYLRNDNHDLARVEFYVRWKKISREIRIERENRKDISRDEQVERISLLTEYAEESKNKILS